MVDGCHIYCNNWRLMSVTLACLSIVIVVFIHTGILCIIVGANISAGINWN